MNYYLTDDQVSMVEMVRDFVDKELIPRSAEMDKTGEFPMEIYKKAVDMGLSCLDLPEEYGGAGVDYFTTALIREELSRGDCGFASALGANGLGFKPVAMAGTEEQKRHYADVILKGGFLSFGITEPNAGSDVSANKTKAVKDGDSYILNGSKCFITNAGLADIYTILACTDPEGGARGMSCFMVDAGTPGLSAGRLEDKMGMRTSHTGDVIMEDVRVPASNMIGEEGDGFKIVMKTLDKGRVNVAASALGVARYAMELALTYSQQRKTYGKAICKHEMIQQKIADMGMAYEAARQLTWRAAAALDAEAKETAKLCAMAKCYATDAAVKIVNDSLQIFGGYGYMKDYPLEKLYRDIRIFQIFEGTNEIQRTIISRNMISEHNI